MKAADIAVDVLLALAVFGEAVCCLGLLLTRSAIDRVHYAGAAATVPAFLIAAAVVVKEALTQPGLDALVVAALLLVLGSVVGHATARLIARGVREL